MNRSAPVYAPAAMDALCRYRWPGNVRELKNLAKRMVILRSGEKIGEEDIGKVLGTAAPPEPGTGFSTLAESERRHIVDALVKCRGVVGSPRGAARLLGLPRSTLQYRMKKLGIEPRDAVETR